MKRPSIKKKRPPKKKSTPTFTPIENDLAGRTFELEGVQVELDPVTKRALNKTAKRLEED